MARRLGWLGPIIVAVGVAASAVAVYFLIHNKPAPGAVLDTIPLDDQATLVIRAEQGGERSFVEMHVDGKLRWQALVPPYAGSKQARGVAWSDAAVTIRVVRGGKAEVFALALRDASKIGGFHLAPSLGPVLPGAPGPVTLTDHVRSYEIVAGEGWNQLVALDLRIGKMVWEQTLGPTPVTAGGVEDGLVWLEQAGTRRYFDVFTGKENRTVEKIGPPPTGGVAPVAPVAPATGAGADASPTAPSKIL